MPGYDLLPILIQMEAIYPIGSHTGLRPIRTSNSEIISLHEGDIGPSIRTLSRIFLMAKQQSNQPRSYRRASAAIPASLRKARSLRVIVIRYERETSAREVWRH